MFWIEVTCRRIVRLGGGRTGRAPAVTRSRSISGGPAVGCSRCARRATCVRVPSSLAIVIRASTAAERYRQQDPEDTCSRAVTCPHPSDEGGRTRDAFGESSQIHVFRPTNAHGHSHQFACTCRHGTTNRARLMPARLPLGAMVFCRSVVATALRHSSWGRGSLTIPRGNRIARDGPQWPDGDVSWEIPWCVP
jgi:hypothetical protein